MTTNKPLASLYKSIVALLICTVLLGCDSEEKDESSTNATIPPVAQARTLGLAPIGAASIGEGFGDIFPTLNSAGASYIESSLLWDRIELNEGSYDYSSTDAASLNAFLPLSDWTVSLAVNAVDTNNDRRPLGLRSLAWDDPITIDAYWAFLQSAVSQFKDSAVRGVSIGNEVDVYFAGRADEQDAYVRFTQAIQSRLKAQYPAFKNGVKTTVEGAMSSTAEFVQNLNLNSDVVMSTYYAIDANFQAASAQLASNKLEEYVNLFPGREIQFLEMGANSSLTCGSSNKVQADFVRAVFSFWDANVDQVSLINFLWMSDIPTADVNRFVQYYGVNSPCFASHLATLGFRDKQGMDKGALAAMRSEAIARGL